MKLLMLIAPSDEMKKRANQESQVLGHPNCNLCDLQFEMQKGIA